MKLTIARYTIAAALALGLAACGGGSDSSSSPAVEQQYGNVPLGISDASSDDWATVGVKILSIALVPQTGGSNVTVYSAPSVAPYVNLVQLDQIAELLGNVSVPVGTYTGAVLTISGNPGDVQLVTAADPEAGFAGPPSTQIASADIQIQHTQGSSGNLSVPVSVTFVSPLAVTTTSSNALDLEFDLSHPAFIIAHQPPGASTLLWAVNFAGPVHHHPIGDVANLVLRHMYGSVTAIATSGQSLTITKDYPTLPAVNPETAVAGSQSVQILADASNGTLFYDLDTGTSATLTSFAGLTGLAAGDYLRVAARYQGNGTLVATRIWASSSFNNVWVSPEGHVLDVNAGSGTITVTNEAGQPVQLAVNSSTEFYFQDGSTAIGSGTAFLSAHNLVRGFKIDASVNPLSTSSPMLAQTINIETANFSGDISAASTSGFTYTHDYVLHTADDYSVALDYISPSSSNGTDTNGDAITGFKWWAFAYPTLITDGTSAASEFVSAASTSISAYGATSAVWGDPANASGWSAPMVVLEPVPLSLATVTSALASGAFTITTLSPSATYTVDVSATSGQSTLVYQVDRSSGIVTVSPVDITTTAGLSTFSSAMVSGTAVKVYGTPQANGTLKAYVVLYYTGTLPQS